MTTLLTARPGLRFAAARQERLFGDGEGDVPAAAAGAPVHEPVDPPVGAPTDPTGAPEPTAAPAPATAPTLDAAITSLWERLTAGHPTACPVCDAPMEPRHSASAGVVGGRCRSCGSTLA